MAAIAAIVPKNERHARLIFQSRRSSLFGLLIRKIYLLAARDVAGSSPLSIIALWEGGWHPYRGVTDAAHALTLPLGARETQNP